jgi:glycosyltransferase involved in cell wall biosynthesis
MDALRVTVIVPTRDRPESLERTLDALGRQTLGDSVEVLVVQDGGCDTLGRLVARWPRGRLIRQDAAGPGAARNLGAREARAGVLCFTDDDCEPAPDWAEVLEAALVDADAAVGLTVNADPHSSLGAASQLVVTHLTEWSLSSYVYGPASNFAARRDVFLDVPFDSARFTFAGGDRDWCDRVHRSGRTLVYVPDALVRHRQQLTLRSYLRQQYSYGRGSYRYRSRGGGSAHFERPSFYAGLISRAFASGPAVGLLTVGGQAANAIGYGREAVLTRILRRGAPRRPRPRRRHRRS